MYAVIETGGKQYKVSIGDFIYVEKLEAKDGAKVKFGAIAYSDDNGLVTGNPIKDVTVTGEVEKSGKSKKITVFTYKPKKGSQRKLGHRQPYTKIKITKIAKSKPRKPKADDAAAAE